MVHQRLAAKNYNSIFLRPTMEIFCKDRLLEFFSKTDIFGKPAWTVPPFPNLIHNRRRPESQHFFLLLGCEAENPHEPIHCPTPGLLPISAIRRIFFVKAASCGIFLPTFL